MKYFLSILLLFLCATTTARSDAATTQTATVSVSFSCTPGGAQCTEFLRLVSTNLGWNAGTGLTRMQFVQAQVLKHLRELGKQQMVDEFRKTAADTAETTFNATYPEQ